MKKGISLQRTLTKRDLKEREILEKYKHFYKPDLPVTQSCMCFGFEINDGWLPLIEQLSYDIEQALKKDPCEFQVTQVKEKYGGLRFYYFGGNDEISKLVDKAEDESYKICEKCGSGDNVTQTKGWIVSLCKRCMSERGNR
jgi:hypothetical protein